MRILLKIVKEDYMNKNIVIVVYKNCVDAINIPKYPKMSR